MLVGLEVLTNHNIIIDAARMECHSPQGWSAGLVKQFGHLFIKLWKFACDDTTTNTLLCAQQLESENAQTINEESALSRVKLKQLHLKLAHASADKLFELLKVAGRRVNSETHSKLRDITEKCQICQRYGPSHRRVRAALPASIVFNEEVIMDVFFISRDPVLHMVDAGTRFSVAKYLPSQSTAAIWRQFLLHWCYGFTGAPRTLVLDQAASSNSSEMASNCASIGLKLVGIPIESHASMGLGERLHGPLRRTVLKLQIQYPAADKELRLATAVKALNDTNGPNGMVHSLLVYGSSHV
jgi:hypothetical protein